LIGKILFSIFLGGCYYFYHNYKKLDNKLTISEQTLSQLNLDSHNHYFKKSP